MVLKRFEEMLMWLMHILHENKYRIFIPVELTISTGVRQKGEKWRI
jgi:hypothetical protein